MRKFPSLTKADLKVMEYLWEKSEVKSSDVIKDFTNKFNWSRQTSRTYLVKLIEKGFVDKKEYSKREYIYFPIVTKEAFATDRTSEYMKTYFGSLSHMVAGLMQNEDIEKEDIEELENLIKNYKSKK